MYRIPDNLTDDALVEWMQDTVKKIDAARDHRTSNRPPMRLEAQAAEWRRALFLQQYACDEDFTRKLSTLYETHRDALAALPLWACYWRIRSSYPARYNEATRAYLRDVNALAEAERCHLNWFRETRGPLAYFGYEAIHRWCLRKSHDLTWEPSYFGSDDGSLPTAPDGNIRIDAFQDPARLEIEPRDAMEARLRLRFEREMKDALDQRGAAYERVGYNRGDTENEVPKYAKWTYRRFVQGEHFKDIAEADSAAAESVRLRTNEFAKAIGFEPIWTRRHDPA